MTFSPPRGNAGRTSLGAVGGARGVGAGALRIILEFITSYDPEAAKQIEADIQRLTAEQKQATAQLGAMEQTRIALQDKLNQGKQASLGLDRNQVAQINDLGTKYANIGKLQGQQLQQSLASRDAEIKAIAQATGLDEKDILALSQKKVLQAQINDYAAQEVVQRKEIASINAEIKTQQSALNEVSRVTPGGLAGGLASLGIGAIGAAAGFAVLGPLLSGVSDWFQKITTSVEDLIDPSRKAADALKNVAQTVDQIASSQQISRLAAAKQLIGDISTATGAGLAPGFQNNEQVANAAELASLNAQIAANLKQQLDIMNAQADSSAEVRKNAADILALRYQQNNMPNPFDPLYVTTHLLVGDIAGVVGSQRQFNDELDNGIAATLQEDQAQQRVKDTLAQQEAIMRQQQSDLQSLLSQALSANVNAGADTVINQLNAGLNTTLGILSDLSDRETQAVQHGLQNTISGIQDRSDARIKALQDRMDALSKIGPSPRTVALQKALDDLSNRGPSQHTKDLQAALDQLAKSEEQRAERQKLADIAEQRHEIILQRQLSLQKSAIDISKYAGKDRLIALNAELARQSKANQAQDRYNQLLSIQYQFSQRLTRQTGESVQQFEERQAQQNRDLLEQAAKLRQQSAADSLSDQKDTVQYQLDLEKNAAAKREAIRQYDLKKHQQELQAELKASQDHDKKLLDAQKKALQARLKASQQADANEVASRRKAIQNEIDGIRKQAQSDIQTARNTAQVRIDQIHKYYDDQKAQVQLSVQNQIAAEKARTAAIALYAQQAEVDRLQSGIAGAHNIAELNTIAGNLAGSNFSDAYITAQLTAMGVDAYTQSVILRNVDNTRAAYNARLQSFQSSLPGLGLGDWIPGHGPGHAKGGFVELTNSMNFGNNGHFGEQGPEIGFVLNNSLSKMFKDTKQQPAVGTVNFNSDERNPSRDMYYLRRTIEEVLSEKLR